MTPKTQLTNNESLAIKITLNKHRDEATRLYKIIKSIHDAMSEKIVKECIEHNHALGEKVHIDDPFIDQFPELIELRKLFLKNVDLYNIEKNAFNGLLSATKAFINKKT
jgi:hypothetical protein